MLTVKYFMKRDFTLTIYSCLLEELIENGYYCTSSLEFLNDGTSASKAVILRHDVDKKPDNSVAKAIIESKLIIKATYYFRTVKRSFEPQIIR